MWTKGDIAAFKLDATRYKPMYLFYVIYFTYPDGYTADVCTLFTPVTIYTHRTLDLFEPAVISFGGPVDVQRR